VSSMPEWSGPIFGGLIDFNPRIKEQRITCLSLIARNQEGSPSIFVFQVNINVRVGQEEGDNGVMAFPTSSVKGREAIIILILPIDIDIGIIPEDLLHL